MPHALTGAWDGTYSYQGARGPVTPFLADLIDRAGSLSGSITEPDAYHGTRETLVAMIVGRRAGGAVEFSKLYVGAPTGYDLPVRYVGQLSQDGLSIVGSWTLAGTRGAFEMHRDRAVPEMAEADNADAVPAS